MTEINEESDYINRRRYFPGCITAFPGKLNDLWTRYMAAEDDARKASIARAMEEYLEKTHDH